MKLCSCQACAGSVLSTAVSPQAALGQLGTKEKALCCTLYVVLVTQGLRVSSVAKTDSKRDQSLITGKVQ